MYIGRQDNLKGKSICMKKVYVTIYFIYITLYCNKIISHEHNPSLLFTSKSFFSFLPKITNI